MKINLKALATALVVVGIGAAGIPAIANAASPAPAARTACVQHGKPGSVLGNVMLYDWNRSVCPPNTYAVSLGGTVVLPASPVHVTKNLGSVASVATGGSFVSNSTEAGTLALPAGSYLISVNAKATPNVSSATPVFPQFFVYNQPKNAAFTGDLFNVGSGALATGSTTLDSYFSGSEVVSLSAPTTLHFYAFGYSPGGAAGSYALDNLTVTAVPVG